MDPALFKEFCDEFTREMNRLRMEGSASLETARSELKGSSVSSIPCLI
jgi:site-specific DNA recombinase